MPVSDGLYLLPGQCPRCSARDALPNCANCARVDAIWRDVEFIDFGMLAMLKRAYARVLDEEDAPCR